MRSLRYQSAVLMTDGRMAGGRLSRGAARPCRRRAAAGSEAGVLSGPSARRVSLRPRERAHPPRHARRRRRRRIK
ncbi:hypothetical protein BOC40_31945 [Burkholderia pseudomallei]|nr:hypothetical protein BOC36_30485 [Burkholderia pseudomallei]ARK60504.1 hypothetical protein BOC37_11595 [Burkholderia pseudomallei]ARK69380.1 hypothetical protein BOC38_21815 [Burkholderia pseudomallei]ARK72698.1 hypothetical protein BOC39_02660 [Burkholderia pseudomallei]ARK84762.1 hypothetical protein BOC40_31945 [Burkholderia pseudomallei]